MRFAFPASTTRIAVAHAVNAERTIREVLQLLDLVSAAGADEVTRFATGHLIEEAIHHLTACRATLA